MNYRTRYLFSSQYVHFSMYFRITHGFDCCWQCFFSSCLIVYPSCEVQKTYIPKPDTFHINTLQTSPSVLARERVWVKLWVLGIFGPLCGKKLEDTKKSRPRGSEEKLHRGHGVKFGCCCFHRFCAFLVDSNILQTSKWMLLPQRQQT